MGIECEEETFRALKDCGIERVEYFGLSDLFESGWQARLQLDAKTWVWVPGGFSFSDDFGAGRLLAYWLKEHGFLDEVLKRGAHLTGICNGFQALSHLNVFGSHTRLLPNAPRGFQNRWVHVALATGEEHKLPVRHGEGRLHLGAPLPEGVQPFLFYRDENFTNGSHERIAGLVSRVGASWCFGMMPHPEIALRSLDAPQTSGTSRMPKFRSEVFDLNGSGFQVIQRMMDLIEQRSPLT
jgi:phosphoribosylformylglycinamidine (FGAM) synthase-like amidotransferase family enzyme